MNHAEQIIRMAMPRAKLRTICEVGERSGISRSTICAKMKNPDKLTKRELRLIVRTTHMKPEELYELVMKED